MKLNTKLIQSINNKLEAISKNGFDEDTIKVLLIDLRDLSNSYPILKEIAHFIAHPERDQGLFKSKINSRFLRLKFSEHEMTNLDFSKAEKNMMFDDFVWNQRNKNEFHSIPKRYFKCVFQDGLDDFSEEFYQMCFKKDKNSIENIIRSGYKKKDGQYHMREKDDKFLDYVMRILQTSVQFDSIISKSDLINELCYIIDDYEIEVGSSNEYSSFIKKYMNDIFVCVLCLLHDINFKDNDDNIGKSFLSVTKNHISLCCEFSPFKGRYIFELISTDIDVRKYFDDNSMININEFEKMDKCSLFRNSVGKLVFT